MLVAFSVAPSGGDFSVGDAVAAAGRVVRKSGLPNETTSMLSRNILVYEHFSMPRRYWPQEEDQC